MRAAVLLIVSIPAMAQPAAPAFYFDLTGDQFVKMMSPPDPTGYEYMQREKAYSYLDGAKDATVGKAWCPPRPRKTFELAYDAADYIKALPTERRKSNAAALLLDFLAMQYPCKGGHQ